MIKMLTSGVYNKTKYIISIDASQKKDVHIIKSFYGLLDVRYKNVNAMNKNLNKNILKTI